MASYPHQDARSASPRFLDDPVGWFRSKPPVFQLGLAAAAIVVLPASLPTFAAVALRAYLFGQVRKHGFDVLRDLVRGASSTRAAQQTPEQGPPRHVHDIARSLEGGRRALALAGDGQLWTPLPVEPGRPPGHGQLTPVPIGALVQAVEGGRVIAAMPLVDSTGRTDPGSEASLHFPDGGFLWFAGNEDGLPAVMALPPNSYVGALHQFGFDREPIDARAHPRVTTVEAAHLHRDAPVELEHEVPTGQAEPNQGLPDASADPTGSALPPTGTDGSLPR